MKHSLFHRIKAANYLHIGVYNLIERRLLLVKSLWVTARRGNCQVQSRSKNIRVRRAARLRSRATNKLPGHYMHSLNFHKLGSSRKLWAKNLHGVGEFGVCRELHGACFPIPRLAFNYWQVLFSKKEEESADTQVHWPLM
jgi:hypothetical protein